MIRVFLVDVLFFERTLHFDQNMLAIFGWSDVWLLSLIIVRTSIGMPRDDKPFDIRLNKRFSSDRLRAASHKMLKYMPFDININRHHDNIYTNSYGKGQGNKH